MNRLLCPLMGSLLLMSGGIDADDHVVPDAYRTVSSYHAVPARILYSIALTETQKRLSDGTVRPWPWTLNIAWNFSGTGTSQHKKRRQNGAPDFVSVHIFVGS